MCRAQISPHTIGFGDSSHAIKRAGFYEFHRSGSHIQLRHPDKPSLRVTIPFHRKDLALKTLRSIIQQANLTVEEFIRLL